MCVLLYAAHTNIDYFPTNFVLQNGEIYYIDFEGNDYMDEWNFENWGVNISGGFRERAFPVLLFPLLPLLQSPKIFLRITGYCLRLPPPV